MARISPTPRAILTLAATVAVILLIALSATVVPPGRAALIARFGRPIRAVTTPGLIWSLPAPLDTVTRIDMRPCTVGATPQDASTRDGQRILVQTFAIWQPTADTAGLARYVTALHNEANEANSQIAGLLAAETQRAARDIALADLINPDPAKRRLATFEATLLAHLAPTLRDLYGITLQDAGVESLSLPEPARTEAMTAMRAERDTIAAQRTAEGERVAASIRAGALRDSRILIADAQTQGAAIEATARAQAADIQAHAYAADPGLYTLLRSLDTLDIVIGPNTRLVLRTDAAPFSLLVNGPPGDAGAK